MLRQVMYIPSKARQGIAGQVRHEIRPGSEPDLDELLRHSRGREDARLGDDARDEVGGLVEH